MMKTHHAIGLFLAIFLAVACSESQVKTTADSDDALDGDHETDLEGGDDSVGDSDKESNDTPLPDDGDKSDTCEPGTLSCLDDEVVHCSPDGSYWEFVLDCTGYGRCVSGHCEPTDIPDGDEEDDAFEEDVADQGDEDTAQEDEGDPDGDDGDAEFEDGDLSEEDQDGDAIDSADGVDEEESDFEHYCYDDQFHGSNRQWQNAIEIEPPVEFEELTLCFMDHDWLKFNLLAGQGVDIWATFSHAIGDIDMRLYSSSFVSDYDHIAASLSSDDDERIVFNAPQDDTYYVNLSVGYAMNKYDLSIGFEPTGYHIPGDRCETAETIEVGETLDRSTDTLNDDYRASCGVATGKDAVFVLILSEPKNVKAHVISSFDAVLSVRSECERPDKELGCSDTQFGNAAETVVLGEVQAGQYYIFVDGYGAGDNGRYLIDVQEIIQED
ncbi:MAG: hypothetical protein C4523_12740 [Myxococcales bacterium]|nr:MAG: hypothetical protein C4523_12740 [Myxococcales bacterium]